MSHVAEGILHAYLDGAIGGVAERREIEDHLNACAVCAGALDDARRVRDRAADILSGSVATREAPPFEQVLTRRSRGTGGRLRRLRVIGLAATLALAVGVVWYAREGWMAGGAGGAGVAGGAEGAGGVGETAAEAAGAARAAERRSGGAPDGLGAASEATPPAAEPPSPAATDPGEDARRQETNPTVLAHAPSDTAAREGGEAEEQRAAERRFPAERVALEPIVVTAAPAPKAADEVRTRDAAAPARPDQQPSAAVSAESDLGQRLRGFVDVGTESGWTPVDADTAAVQLGRSPAVVPDLPVVAYGIREGDPPQSVRVIQALGDGMVIELIERKIADRAAGRMIRVEAADVRGIASFLPDSAATVRIERDGYEIIGRANLPAESLRVLVAKIR